MRAYSMDLRLRVLADCDKGMATSAVASKHSVEALGGGDRPAAGLLQPPGVRQLHPPLWISRYMIPQSALAGQFATLPLSQGDRLGVGLFSPC
jgi:hypothetical protein